MKTLGLLILFVGLCAFVSAEEDYDFVIEEFDSEDGQDLGKKRPHPGKLLKAMLKKVCGGEDPPKACQKIKECKEDKLGCLKKIVSSICERRPDIKLCEKPFPSERPSGKPSRGPSGKPSRGPSGKPSRGPSGKPSRGPSGKPRPTKEVALDEEEVFGTRHPPTGRPSHRPTGLPRHPFRLCCVLAGPHRGDKDFSESDDDEEDGGDMHKRPGKMTALYLCRPCPPGPRPSGRPSGRPRPTWRPRPTGEGTKPVLPTV